MNFVSQVLCIKFQGCFLIKLIMYKPGVKAVGLYQRYDEIVTIYKSLPTQPKQLYIHQECITLISNTQQFYVKYNIILSYSNIHMHLSLKCAKHSHGFNTQKCI